MSGTGKKFLLFWAFLLFLGQTVPLSGEILRTADNRRQVRYAGKLNKNPVFIRDYPAPGNEFRGVWVAVVENIDFPRHKTAAEFRKDFRVMVDKIAAAGFTAVIFQIRSNCDALYPSKLAPYSRWLSGKEGVGIRNFDPLSFMIAECHKRKLEFHAWLNPYRVCNATPMSKNAYLKTLSPKNFARKNPQWVIAQRNGKNLRLFLDPGVPQVVAHLTSIVSEILLKYPVDAIHFDDYFYPYEQLTNEDEISFRRFNYQKLSKANWRRNNTRTLIASVKRTVADFNKKYRRKVVFGVSPFGIWGNAKNFRNGSLTDGKESYSILYADTRRWVKERLVDYIVPQIYWHFDHDTAAYAALTDWWCRTVRGTGVKLYIGHGAYRDGAIFWGNNELVNQVRYNRMRKEISGSAFFSYRSLFGAKRKGGALRLLNFYRRK